MPCREPGCSCEEFRLKARTKNQCSACNHADSLHFTPAQRHAPPPPPGAAHVAVVSGSSMASSVAASVHPQHTRQVSAISPNIAPTQHTRQISAVAPNVVSIQHTRQVSAIAPHLASTTTTATVAVTNVPLQIEGVEDFSYVVTFSFLGAPAHEGEEDFWDILAHAGILRCFTNTHEDKKDYLEFRLIENYTQKIWKVPLESCFLPNHDALKKTSAMKAKSFFKKKGVAELIPEQPEVHLVYSNQFNPQAQPTQLHIGFSSQRDKAHFLTQTSSKVKIVTSSTHVQLSTSVPETRVMTAHLEQRRGSERKEHQQLQQQLQQHQQIIQLQQLQQQQQQPQPQLSPSLSNPDLPVSVQGGHSCFELTFDMMMGIRTVVSKVEAQTMRPCAASYEYTQTSRIRFPAKGSKSTPAHGGTDFYFKDYCPMLFRRVRSRFGIDPAHYLLTLCGDFAYLEFVSNSKSGEFFFFSHNREFLIKTISKAECKMLLRVMEEYYNHISSCDDTFITRFFGVHKVRPGKAKETYFLIMGSVFPTTKSIHATFDLKGATLGRNASEQDKAKGNKCVYKDNDFREQNIRIKIGVRNKARLMNQIKKDVALLEKFGIMDYSMLVGIHYKDRPNEPVFQSFSRQDSIRAIDAGYQPLPISASHTDIDRDRVGGVGEDIVVLGEGERGEEKAGGARSIEGDLLEDEDSSDSSEDEKGLFYIWQKEDLLAAEESPKSSTENGSSSNDLSADTKFATPRGKKGMSSAESPAMMSYRRSLSTTEKVAGKGFFQMVDGGFESSSEHGSNEVYFMGIIDILIEYGIRKKGETLVKSLRHNKAEISSVDPSMYAERFVKFLEASID